MKRKQLFMVVLALVMAAFLAAPALAANTWVYANVVETGPGSGAYYVKLKVIATAYPYTPVSPTTRYHVFRAGQEKEMLAVALTALSTGKYVLAYVDYNVNYSTVSNLYVVESLPSP